MRLPSSDMKNEQRKLAQQIMAALEQVVLPPNTDILIQVLNDEIKIKVTEHIYASE